MNRAATISQFSYTYDQLGNRLSKQEIKKSTNYQYDALSRLLKALESKADKDDKDDDDKHKPKLRENYTYDSVGNRLIGPKKQSYQYNSSNELLQYKDVNLQYDLNGNVIIKEKIEEEEKELTTFSYNPENRLVQVIIQEFEEEELEEQKTITYVYDPFGRRIEKQVEEIEVDENDEDEDEDEEEEDDNEDDKDKEAEIKIERYLYDNEDILAVYDNKGRIISSFVHGPGIDEPLAITQKNKKKKKTFFYQFDGLGSVVGLTDKKGKVAQRFEYDSFGKLKQKGSKVKQPYAFTGREYDKETKLYYYRARYYDPEVGRFVSRDPVSGLGVSSQGINHYPYTQNNPINLIDPSGLWVFGLGIDLGAGLGFGLSGQGLLLVDNHGNQAFAIGGAFGLTTTTAEFSGIAVILPAHDATIEDLGGVGGCAGSLGGTIGPVGVSIGVLSTGSCSSGFTGVTIQGGVAAQLTPIAASVERTATAVYSISDTNWKFLGLASPVSTIVNTLEVGRTTGKILGTSIDQAHELLQSVNEFFNPSPLVGSK